MSTITYRVGRPGWPASRPRVWRRAARWLHVALGGTHRVLRGCVLRVDHLFEERPVTDDQVAAELADILTRHCTGLGPVGRIGALSRLLRILRLTVRLVTGQRDREAYALAALYPQRKLARYAAVTPSTMQRWTEAGRPRPIADALYRYACLI